MKITLDKFIKQFCVRKKEHITRPPIHDIKDFVLPRNSHLHFLTKDGTEIGIKADNPLLTYLEKDKKVSQFIKGYMNSEAGGFKIVTVKIDEQIRDYFKRNRGITNGLHSKSDLLLDKNLVITNYGLMEEGVSYFTNNIAWYFKHQNRWKSIRDYVEEAARKDRRSHFIIIDIPETMPSVSQLKKLAVDKPSTDLIRAMANSQRMLISDFWNWFDPALPTTISHDLNLNNRLFYIFRFHDKWLVFNPKMLLSYLKSNINPKGDYKLIQMRKNFLVMLLTPIFGDVDLITLDDDDEEGLVPKEIPTDEDKAILRRDTKDDTVGFISNPESNGLATVQDKIKEGLEKSLTKAENIDEYEETEIKKSKKIDKFLEGLETVNANAVEATENMDAPEQTVIKTDEGKTVTPSIDRSEVVLDYKAYQPADLNHEEAFKAKLNEHIITGVVSPLQKRRFEKLASRYKEIPNPVTGVGTLEQAAHIEPKDLLISKDKKFIDKINMVGDESMLKSSLLEFDKKYIENVMQKDVYNAVMAVQRRGVAIQNYQVKRVKRLGDEYDVHTVKLVPLEGEPSTVNFKIPVINEYGVFQSRSVKLRTRKQRTDCPIRKISHDEVALTSDYSKFFVERSQFAAYSSERWLRGQLVAIDGEGLTIRWGNASNIVEGRPFDRMVDEAQSGKDISLKDINAQKRTPLVYSMMGRYVKSIEKGGYSLFFNANELETNFGKDVVKTFDKSRSTQILLGKGKDSLLILTNNGIVHECSVTSNDNKELGSLFDFLGINTDKQPEDCADVIMSMQSIPLGVLLGLYLGLGNLLKTLDVDNHFVPKGTRGFSIDKGHIGIVFADGTLVCDVRGKYKAQLIIAGFNRYKKHIKQYSVYEFDKPSVYSAVFSSAGLPGRFMREFSILRDMWVDHIAYGELVAMGEPTDFILLLIRAAELLEFDQHPEEMDRAYQRDRGYERISGFVYSELVKGIRVHDSTPVKERAKVSINPEAVWMDIIGDETTAPIEESNPIHILKEMETVVYRGAGGRSDRTMNANSRKFSKNSIGVDSESTVDNGGAGTVRFLSANPNYNSVRGTVNSLDVLDETVNSSCLNTSFLLAPGLEFDDPKRRNFCQIQNSRTTNSEGAKVLPVRTGYERVLPYRTPDLFATMATEEGKVVRVTEAAIVVKYKSGKEKSIELGKRDGKWAGKIIPHQVITNLKEGQKVNVGDAIAFNPMFFEIDTLGGTLAYKSGTLCRVGLVEEEFTFEDASEISSKFADQLITRNCEERFITVRFDQDVKELVKVGQHVDYDTTLCILQSNIGGVADAYGTGVEALRDIASLTPRAKHDGKVTDISAIYVGDVEDMSPTLQEIVNASDRKLYKKARDLGVERDTGQKKSGERFEGKTLEPKTAIIKIVIDITQDMGVGSKVVYGHQMKSVVSNVWDEVFTTQDGNPYDAKFSYTSFVKRVVKSGLLIGILNTYSVENGKRLWEIYENG